MGFLQLHFSLCLTKENMFKKKEYFSASAIPQKFHQGEKKLEF